jgi:hypothetical protein
MWEITLLAGYMKRFNPSLWYPAALMSCWSSFCHLFFRLPGQFWYSAVSPVRLGGAGFLDTFIFLSVFLGGALHFTHKRKGWCTGNYFWPFFLSFYLCTCRIWESRQLYPCRFFLSYLKKPEIVVEMRKYNKDHDDETLFFSFKSVNLIGT